MGLTPHSASNCPHLKAGANASPPQLKPKALLDTLDPVGRALWATALYAGLRRGELRALDWQDIDLSQRVIHVRCSWDRKAGPIEPKTAAATRSVPIPETLHTILLRHHLRHGRPRNGYVFMNRRGQPFDPSTVLDRARKAWKAAGLPAIGLHECRHTYASLAIAAGISPKAISTYLGHASITITPGHAIRPSASTASSRGPRRAIHPAYTALSSW